MRTVDILSKLCDRKYSKNITAWLLGGQMAYIEENNVQRSRETVPLSDPQSTALPPPQKQIIYVVLS